MSAATPRHPRSRSSPSPSRWCSGRPPSSRSGTSATPSPPARCPWAGSGRLAGPRCRAARCAAGSRRRAASGRAWSSSACSGSALYNVALNAGERRVDAGTAAMLIQLSPVLVAVLAAVFLEEKATPALGVGLLVAFSGVVLIATSTSDGGDRDPFGVVLCLVSAAAYAVSLILQKPLVSAALRHRGHLDRVHGRRRRLPAVRRRPGARRRAAPAPPTSAGWSTSGCSPRRSRSRRTPSRSPHERRQPRA